ncbi:MAG TPA: YopX family protein [Acetivibrio sp.]|nr:YopX family protein [Acetivibrio sp.]
MQREIKFRAWNKLEKRMESVNFIKFFLNDYTMVSTRYRDEKSKKIYDDQFAYGQEDGSDNVILMQFIGLHDKNGIEIYEGDIISAYNGRIKGPVIFDKRGLAFGVPNGPNEIYQFSMNFLESKDIKVIGNIYENPEILKV